VSCGRPVDCTTKLRCLPSLDWWKRMSVFWPMPCRRLFERTFALRVLIPLTGRPIRQNNASQNAVGIYAIVRLRLLDAGRPSARRMEKAVIGALLHR